MFVLVGINAVHPPGDVRADMASQPRGHTLPRAVHGQVLQGSSRLTDLGPALTGCCWVSGVCLNVRCGWRGPPELSFGHWLQATHAVVRRQATWQLQSSPGVRRASLALHPGTACVPGTRSGDSTWCPAHGVHHFFLWRQASVASVGRLTSVAQVMFTPREVRRVGPYPHSPAWLEY